MFADLVGAEKLLKIPSQQRFLSENVDGVQDQIQHAHGMQIEFSRDLVEILVANTEGVAVCQELGVTFCLFPEENLSTQYQCCAKALKFCLVIWC